MAKKINTNENENIVAAKILEQPIERAIHDYMMPYAESVILDRALPRVEDGLKPVQRRILFTMHELNMKPEGQYKKSARIVGDCLGKYHPHGDSSVYDAMVNMAQDFGMRNVLVDGNGNFGSIDGDSAAAMRYTEVKMAPLAVELLKDLDKDTVNWVNNFDDSLQEPEVLPGRFPNILVNGAQGIAIGLATTIPTHNLTEVIDAVIAYIENPKIPLEELLKIVKGPDFPTGGFVAPVNSFEEIYRTGRGKIQIRSRISIENDAGKQTIVVHEIPYLVNKGRLQVQIKEAKDKDIEKNGKNALLNGITDIVDESDRNGIRIAIKLKKGEDAQKILESLYKKTSLQTNFSYNIMVIAEGRPQQLGLIPILRYYVEHQRVVILRRSKFDLNNNKKRAHILDGYVIVLDNIDEVIALIKGSKSRSDAKEALMGRFTITEKQADAILDLKLANLTKLERDKILNELEELRKKISHLEKIVNSKAEQLKVVKNEIAEIRNNYRVKRLTTIVQSFDEFNESQLAVSNTVGDKRGYVVVGAKGDIKLVGNVQFLNDPGRSKPTKINDMIVCQVFSDAANPCYAFTNLGNCIKLDLSQLNEVRNGESGIMPNAITDQLQKNEKFIKVLILKQDDENKNLIMYTRNGMVKKTQINEYFVNRQVYDAIVLKENDEVINVEIEEENKAIVEIADNGCCLVFMTNEVNATGRKTAGVTGMKLEAGASIICAKQIILDDYEKVPVGEIVFITNTGYAKRVYGFELSLTKRANKGVEKIKVDTKGELIYADIVTEAIDIAIVDASGNVNVVNSEDIMIIRPIKKKGNPLAIAFGAILAIKQDSNVI